MRFPLTLFAALALGASIGGVWGYFRAGPSAGLSDMMDVATQRANDAATSAKPAPRVYVDESNFEFGSMQNNTTQSHEFTFENRGDQPLVLIAGQPTCKCTIGEVPAQPIPPGGAGRVLVEWTPRALGDFRQIAPILTNDLRTPRVELTVHGTVVATAGLEPQQFDFGRIHVGDPAKATALLTSMDRESFQLTVEPPTESDGRPLLTAETSPLSADELPDGAKSGYRITLTASDRLPIGFFLESVTLKTDLKGMELIRPFAQAQVEGDFSIRGQSFNQEMSLLNLGVIPSSEGKISKLLVVLRGEHADDLEMEVESVDPPEIEVRLAEIEHPKPGLAHVKMEVRIPPGAPPIVRLGNDLSDDGEVRLRTNHPDSPVVSFRVRVAVR